MEPCAAAALNEVAVPRRVLRVGSVSFLNAKPLIHGLESAKDVNLSLAVPSRLLEGLRQGSLDVALLPVIDYQRLAGLRIVPRRGRRRRRQAVALGHVTPACG